MLTLPSSGVLATPKPKKRKLASTNADDDDDEAIGVQLSPDDPAHFFLLGATLKAWLRRTLTEKDIEDGHTNICLYLEALGNVSGFYHSDVHLLCGLQLLTAYIKLYGDDMIRPNHHWSIHTAEFLRDYGPVYGFWTFLFERLNKVLKSFRTNNHGGGELEVTFFREFLRTSQVSRIVNILHNFAKELASES